MEDSDISNLQEGDISILLLQLIDNRRRLLMESEIGISAKGVCSHPTRDVGLWNVIRVRFGPRITAPSPFGHIVMIASPTLSSLTSLE